MNPKSYSIHFCLQLISSQYHPYNNQGENIYELIAIHEFA